MISHHLRFFNNLSPFKDSSLVTNTLILMEGKAPKEKKYKKKQHEIAFYSVGQCQLLVRNESEKPTEMNAISLKDFQKYKKYENSLALYFI